MFHSRLYFFVVDYLYLVFKKAFSYLELSNSPKINITVKLGFEPRQHDLKTFDLIMLCFSTVDFYLLCFLI